MALVEKFIFINVTSSFDGGTSSGGGTIRNSVSIDATHTLEMAEELLQEVYSSYRSAEMQEYIEQGLITCEQLRDGLKDMLDGMVVIEDFNYFFTMGDLYVNSTVPSVKMPEDNPDYRPGVREYFNSGVTLAASEAGGTLRNYLRTIDVRDGSLVVSGDLGDSLSYSYSGQPFSVSATSAPTSDTQRSSSITFSGRSFNHTISSGYDPSLIDDLMPPLCGGSPPIPPGVAPVVGTLLPLPPPEDREENEQKASAPPLETVISYANHTFELPPFGRGK